MFLTTAAVLEMGACIGRTVSKTLLQKNGFIDESGGCSPASASQTYRRAI